jgi:hypothetical protein
LPLPVLTTTVAVALADEPYASVAMPYIVITLFSVASPAGSTDDADLHLPCAGAGGRRRLVFEEGVVSLTLALIVLWHYRSDLRHMFRSTP